MVHGTETPTNGVPALDMRGVGKRFGDQWVLRDVDFTVRRGSIHALVGHNGAGKSTLMKVALAGYEPNEGSVEIGGQPLTFTRPAEARELGLGMVFQERSLIQTLNGLDNIYLNAEDVNRVGLVRTRAERTEALELCAQLGIPPELLSMPVSEMSQLQQEMVEIAKAVRLAKDVLILDEPTAPLTTREIDALFAALRNVARLGVGVVFITHHLAEIFSISDEVTTLREGRVTLFEETSQTDMSEVIQAMLGQELIATETSIGHSADQSPPPHDRGEAPVLHVSEVRLANKLTGGVSFELYPREILGVAGLAGSGRTSLLRFLYGDLPSVSGSVIYRGEEYRPSSPTDAIARSIFFIPEDRRLHGLVLTTSILENVILPVLGRITRFLVVQMSRARDLTRRSMQSLDIRARGPGQRVSELSGGNQQKVVLTKALAAESELLLLDEPTFGVDIGAAGDLIKHVRELVDSGKAALWVTSDLRELLEVSDRILILADGTIQRVITRGDPDFDEPSMVRAMQRRHHAETQEGMQ